MALLGWFFGLALAGSWVSAAAAQTLPPQAEPRTPTIEDTRPQVPLDSFEIPAIRLPETGAPPGAEDIVFVLRSLTIDGVSVYEPADLEVFYADELGKQISLAELFAIVNSIEARYRGDGYFLSRAVLPAQTVQDGVFRIDVIEGYISAVTLVGEVGPSHALLERYLANITEPRPVNIADIERYLLLANDVPGIQAIGVLQPSPDEPGAAQLVVNLQRKFYDGFARLDNRESEFTGPWSVVVGGGLNGLTPFGDRSEITLLTGMEAKESRYAGGTLEGRFGDEGLVARVYANVTKSEPGFTLKALEVESESHRVGFGLVYPILRSRRANLWANGGFDYVHSESDLLDLAFIEDDLSVAWAGLLGDYRDRFNGANLVDVRLRQGLDILGASGSGDGLVSRADADGTFTAIQYDLARLQRVSSAVNLYFGLSGQYAFQPLLADESFTLGGYEFGRGYDPAELSDDNGLAGTIELQIYPDFGLDYVDNYHVYGFYDIGQVWGEDQAYSQGQSLASGGIGLRVGVTDWLQVDFEVAQPLTKSLAASDGGKKSPQVFISVTTRF